ncbi:MAG TPA: sigma-54-dependent Fis family transcriptional regulator [Candidatus Binatia bacterium]|nr:sigma-54-dependent Fis family transcriptional regulator [Candidatus Binatia bacterium]
MRSAPHPIYTRAVGAFESIVYKSTLVSERSYDATVVRRLRDRFLAGRGDGLDALRPIVRDSWLRCRSAGVDPALCAAPIILSRSEAESLRAQSPLRDAAAPVLRMLEKALDGHCFLVLLADPQCRPVEVLGHPRALDAAERINVVLGSQWSEDKVGTDALAVSAVLGVPVQIHWAENYAEILGDRWTGNAAPLARGGTLCLYGYDEIAHPHALDLVTDCASMIDARLGEQELRRTTALLDHYRTHQSRHPSDLLVCVRPDGAVVAGTARALELLALGRGAADGPARLPGFPTRDAREPESCEIAGHAGAPVRATVTPVRAGDALAGYLVAPAPRAVPTAGRRPRSAWAAAHTFADIVGESDALRRCLADARRIAARELPVLLIGESGSGKELFAHAIHAASARHEGPFVPLNCGGLSEELVGAELFGYAEGAFTGAVRGGRAGKIELAHGGTLFLDEVEEMPPRMQVHLLRVLEEGRVVRIGDDRPRAVDVRIVAATKVNLAANEADRRFREDLYHRLHVLSLTIPPLRVRLDDLPLLARHLLARESVAVRITPEASALLVQYAWPGNVRELRNVLLQAAERAAGGDIGVDAVRPLLPLEPDAAPPPVLSILDEAEKGAIVRALRDASGNVTRAAAGLGLHRVTLHRKMERYGITVARSVR